MACLCIFLSWPEAPEETDTAAVQALPPVTAVVYGTVFAASRSVRITNAVTGTVSSRRTSTSCVRGRTTIPLASHDQASLSTSASTTRPTVAYKQLNPTVLSSSEPGKHMWPDSVVKSWTGRLLVPEARLVSSTVSATERASPGASVPDVTLARTLSASYSRRQPTGAVPRLDSRSTLPPQSLWRSSSTQDQAARSAGGTCSLGP